MVEYCSNLKFERATRTINGIVHVRVRAKLIVDDKKFISRQQGKGAGLTLAEATQKALNDLMNQGEITGVMED